MLTDTGERMIPGVSEPGTFWEHIERYRFASQFVQGLDVVDIACGEGYGTAGMVRAGARSVVGIDISPTTVAHAQQTYGVDARLGSAEEIPLPDESVDVLISFETIEHVRRPELFIKECRRVLRATGVVVMSTPNPEIYRTQVPSNQFHCSEMSPDEFRRLLSSSFTDITLFAQCGPAPWYCRVRGFGRLFRFLRGASAVRQDSSDPARLCSARSSWVERLFSMDRVSKKSEAELLKSMYIVAVASRKQG